MLQMYKEIAGRVLQKQVFLTFLVLLMMQTSAFGQKDSKITIQQKNMTVIEALKSVERQTKMSINYSDSQLKSKKLTNLNLKNALITTALDTILKGTGFTYQIRDNYVIVTEQKSVAPSVVKNIRGKVVDENGEPLIGVNISVEGSSTGTITDMNGNFMIKASDKSKLKISYIGYATQMIAVSNKDFYQVVLKQDAEVLDEVVVTALGIKRAEKALSYNVQQVKGDELTTVKDANFISSLNGKVAGVTINSSNSTGGASRVVMRGVKSITSSNLALYVIDGVPMYNMMNGGNSQSVFADQPGTDGAADINPEDIESISMLTGPSAAALYGNAAAAGVVLITTKKGSVDKTSVTVSNNTTFSKVAIDARKREDGSGWNIYKNGGRVDVGIDAIEWAKKVESLGAGEILLTSMDCDGTKAGYDLELTKAVAESVSIPVIASGGAGIVEHFKEALTDGGADAALAASLCHYKELEIRQVKEYLREQGISVRLI